MDALQEYFGIEAFDFETNKKKLVDNLNYLKAMTVEEQTFYKKWQEIQSYNGSVNKLNEVKAKILVKDEKKGVDASKVLDALNLFGEKKIVENERVNLAILDLHLGDSRSPSEIVSLFSTR